MEKEVDLIAALAAKSCKNCTKCCEGYLSANIRGHEMTLGTPCFFVTQNVGCREYDLRPTDPCVGFECEWKRNPYFEEWLSPNNSGILFSRQYLKPSNIPFLQITEAGATLTPKILTWAIKYSEKNLLNLMWKEGTITKFVGSTDFLKAISETLTVSP